MTPEGLALLEEFEDCRLLAYLDSGGVYTIGIGTTRYPPWHLGGRRVQQGDICTRAQAMDFMRYNLTFFEHRVDDLTRDGLLPRQDDALTCFAYNVGIGSAVVDGYMTSRLRRLVNANPADPAIRVAFMLWHKDRINGALVPVRGLWNRRHREADHYFGTVTPCPHFPYPA